MFKSWKSMVNLRLEMTREIPFLKFMSRYSLNKKQVAKLFSTKMATLISEENLTMLARAVEILLKLRSSLF